MKTKESNMETLHKEMDRLFDKHGVASSLVVVRDPDSHDVHRQYRGDDLWVVGALESELWRIKKNWSEP